MSLCALSIGLPMLLAAIVGLERTVTVDGSRREIRVDLTGSFGFSRTTRHQAASLSAVEVRRDRDSDGPDRFMVEARTAGRRRVRITTRPKESDAADVAAGIRRLLWPD